MDASALSNAEDRLQSSGGDEEAASKQDVLHKAVPFMSDLEKSSMEPVSVASASSSWKEEDQHHEQRIEMAKAEMSQVREENQRLKMCLDQIMKDYETLKRQFNDIMQREGKKSTQTSASTIHDEAEEVDDMVSLTLGRVSSDQNKNNISSERKDHKILPKHDWGSLGLAERKSRESEVGETNKTPPNDSVRSPTVSEPKEEEAGETWPPSKTLKSLPAGEDEVSQQNPPKKARVCVRARCDTPTMNDGCQWRKYGQKIAKGNPCPRAYYRCTGAPSCPVRKQVQRSVDDISILITTYEGTHNHPLPVSAMAMASTTSAAVSMLLSGSSTSTSRPGLNPPSAANLPGMNLYLSNNSNSKQFYLPNSSILSSSLNHPTITLDLTSNPPSTSSSSPSPFNKIPSSYPPKYPFTSLDFGSSQSNLMSWNTGGYGSHQAYSKNNALGMASDLAKQLPLHTNIYQTYLQKMNNPSSTPPLPQPAPLPDTIAAATKAITSDPSFQSVLAAALSSIIGGSGNGGEMLPSVSSFLQTAQGSVCASTLLGKSPSATTSQQGSLAFQPPPSLTCSPSKSPSSSPGDSRENTK